MKFTIQIKFEGHRLNTNLQESGAASYEANPSLNSIPTTGVGLDSGYIKDCRPHSMGSFEVVVERIFNKRRDYRSLGFARSKIAVSLPFPGEPFRRFVQIRPYSFNPMRPFD